MREVRTMHRTFICLENFRSFAGTYEIEVAPLTVLVGENSTGKTSLLAGIQGGLNGFLPLPYMLQEEPFCLPFPRAQISAGAKSMRIGKKITDGKMIYRVASTLDAKGTGIPGEVVLEMEGIARMVATRHRGRSEYDVVFTPEALGGAVTAGRMRTELWHLPTRFAMALREGGPQYGDAWSFLKEVTSAVVGVIAPTRNKPERMYIQKAAQVFDFVTGIAGGHAPQVLDKLLRSRSSRKGLVVSRLREFGVDSGLFTDVRSRGINTPAGRHFSILLTKGGSEQTLQDVGYGVSQVLPIVGELLEEGPRSQFLIQQPEIHLHPRAQSVLAGFFTKYVADGAGKLVVETHSDYIVDRIRLEVLRGNIEPSLVRIYFLELVEGRTCHRSRLTS
jgi:hypothetical protein